MFTILLRTILIYVFLICIMRLMGKRQLGDPSGFSRTASQTLSAATLPHALAIAEKGVEKALLDDKHLRRGLTTYKGKLCLLETALKHNLPFTDPKDAIEGC